MAKKEEDNRDIFEKALDYAPIVIGTLVGGALGVKAGAKAGKKFKAADIEEGYSASDFPKGATSRESRKEFAEDYAKRRGTYYKAQLGISGSYLGGVAGAKIAEPRKEKRRK